MLINLIVLCSCSRNIEEDNCIFKDEAFIEVKRNYGLNLNVLSPPSEYEGILFSLKENSKIFSYTDGEVVGVENLKRGKGNYVNVLGKDGVEIKYYHLGKILVSKSQKVKKGEKIAISGKTGLIIENGLGLEVIFDGEKINPDKYVKCLKF